MKKKANSTPVEVSLVGAYQGDRPDGIALVETDQDYVACCRGLRDGDMGPVWVRGNVHFVWLKSFAELIGANVVFIRKTPRRMLAEKWGVDVPQWLDDTTVEGQHLLDLDIPAEHPPDFARTVLVAVLGDAFAADRLTLDVLIRSVEMLSGESASVGREQYPVVDACLKDCCERWCAAGTEMWVQPVCDAIQSNPEHLHRDLSYYALLGAYPSQMLEFKVSLQRATALRSIDLTGLRKLSLHRLAMSDSAEQVAIFFQDVGASVSSAEDYRKVLGCTSGFLGKEFECLHGLLATGKFAVTRQLVQDTRDHFAAGRAVSLVKLDELSNLVVPPRPSMPGSDQKWEWEEWLQWVIGEYFPYRNWQQHSLRYDAELERVVAQFSDWYLSAYVSIHAHPERSLVHALSALSESVTRDDVSLVFIVDCLPGTFLQQLSASFGSAGFHRHDLRFVCAPLPTYTEVCKPLLLSGDWNDYLPSYEKILSKRAAHTWPGKRLQYFAGDLKALRDSNPRGQPCILVLNYLPGDDTLHSDVEGAGSSFEEELRRLYTRLADAAREVFERWGGPAERFGVYVLTDHGATRTLSEETETLDTAVVKKLFPSEKHRFASIEDSDAGSVPENLWRFGYKFKQPFLSSNETYFVPRGHNTIRSGIPKGYVHGGATPEEVVVPLMAWKPVAVPWKAPGIRFVGLSLDPGSKLPVFYVKRIITLKLELQNSNSKPIEVKRIDILSPSTEVRRSSSGLIQPGKALLVEVECSFGAAAQKADELLAQVAYSIEGLEQVTDCSTAALFKSAVTGGFNLKDLKARGNT